MIGLQKCIHEIAEILDLTLKKKTETSTVCVSILPGEYRKEKNVRAVLDFHRFGFEHGIYIL